MAFRRNSRLGVAFFLVWPLVPVAASYYGVTRYGIEARAGPVAVGATGERRPPPPGPETPASRGNAPAAPTKTATAGGGSERSQR